jgi:hypothetical protein
MHVLFAYVDDVDGPCGWQDLNLDELAYTPARQRHMFHANGERWQDPNGLQHFANDAALKAWADGVQ